jgi:hypothetical protein
MPTLVDGVRLKTSLGTSVELGAFLTVFTAAADVEAVAAIVVVPGAVNFS